MSNKSNASSVILAQFTRTIVNAFLKALTNYFCLISEGTKSHNNNFL